MLITDGPLDILKLVNPCDVPLAHAHIEMKSIKTVCIPETDFGIFED